jgi:prepilin-type N-terminal cleavage/methylation domain-containing protein
MRSFIHKQKGDTLVEVMIAMMIISSVLAVSYGIASTALRIGQATQERTEALKIAEGQVELIIAAANDSTRRDSLFTTLSANTPFCNAMSVSITINGTSIEDSLLNDLLTAKLPPLGSKDYHDSCARGIDKRYKINIVRIDVPGPLVGSPIESTFRVRVRWYRVGGGKDQVELRYKIHKGQF